MAVQNDTIKTRVVGVDVSVNMTAYAIVDIRGNIIAEESFPTTDYPELGTFVSTLCERILLLCEANGGIETIRSVGMSVISANYLTGSIENAANLPWKGVIPLEAMMRDRLGLAVVVANDAHVSALGERTFGSAHGMKDFVLVTIGLSGVGSCIVADSRPHLGANGFAGEVGHTCVALSGRPCGCGRQGCLERYVSVVGIRQTALELMDRWKEPSVLKKDGDLSPEMIAQACEAGDSLALAVMEKTGNYLGFALANYATVINPEAIILTGMLSKMGDWLIRPTQKVFDRYVFQNVRGRIRILVSDLDDHQRAVLGASVLAWDVKAYSLFK